MCISSFSFLSNFLSPPPPLPSLPFFPSFLPPLLALYKIELLVSRHFCSFLISFLYSPSLSFALSCLLLSLSWFSRLRAYVALHSLSLSLAGSCYSHSCCPLLLEVCVALCVMSYCSFPSFSSPSSSSSSFLSSHRGTNNHSSSLPPSFLP